MLVQLEECWFTLPLSGFGFVKHQVYIDVWIINSILLINLSVFVPIQFCYLFSFGYLNGAIWKHEISLQRGVFGLQDSKHPEALLGHQMINQTTNSNRVKRY